MRRNPYLKRFRQRYKTDETGGTSATGPGGGGGQGQGQSGGGGGGGGRGDYNRTHEHGHKPDQGGGGGGGQGGGGGGQGDQGGHGGGGNQPFSPLAPGFDTNAEFREAIRQRTHQALQDQLNPLRQEMARETGASENRLKDLSQYYRYYGNELEGATDQLSQALAQLQATGGQASGTAQQALMGALSGQRTQDLAQAAAVGGVAPTNAASQQALLTAAAEAGSAQGTLGQVFGGMLGQSAGRRGIAALDKTRAQEDETTRAAGILQDLARQKVAIRQSKPELREEARSSILQEERDAAAQRLQARLAREQIAQQEKESKRAAHQSAKDRQQQQEQFEQQMDFDRDQLAQQQQQFEDQLAADVADGNLTNNEADAGIGKFRSARTQMENWLGEHAGKKLTDSMIKHLYTMLQENYNIPAAIIRKVFRGSGNPRLAHWSPKGGGDDSPFGDFGGSINAALHGG